MKPRRNPTNQSSAQPVEPQVAFASPLPKIEKGKATPAGKSSKLAKNKKSPSPTATPLQVASSKATEATAPPLPKFSVPPATTTSASPQIALAPPSGNATSPVQPLLGDGGALASTAGGGNWKTYPPGKMPTGRLIAPNDLAQIADRDLVGERIYLRGQFVVNFADANKAVLRPRSRVPDSVVRLTGNSTRIIVEYPAGHTPPAPGSTVNRDEVRPLEITEVRKQEDGQLNVFAREIMQP